MESLGCEDASRRRRLVERICRRGRRGALSGGDRLGHGRLDPHSGSAVRHHRLEAHLRSRQPLRRRAAVRHARLDRPARPHGRGLRAAARGDVGPDPRDPATLAAPRGDLDVALEELPDVRDVRITALAPEALPPWCCPT
jgi:hypothetical protein